MRTMEEMAQWLKDSYEERKIRYTHSYGKAYKVDKNGTLYFANFTCKRCGGAGGADQWIHTGWTCYECGGSGTSSHPDTVKLMLPEYEIKLEERRAKRYAKKQAEHNAKIAEIRKQWLLNHNWTADGFTYIFLGNTYEMKDSIKAVGGTFNRIMGWFINHEVEGFQMLKVSMDGVLCETYDGYDYIVDAPIATMKKEAERKAVASDAPASEFVGELKERLKGLKVTLAFHTAFEGHGYSYYDDGTRYFYSFKDEKGNIFTWTTSSCLDIENGAEVVLDGTVNGHKEYKGEKQTVLNRCKIY